MFSTRTIIWIVLIVFLLPADEKGKKDLYNKANTAISYVQGACNSVEVCAKFDPSWSTFTKKAQTGADLIADLIASSPNMEAAPTPLYPRLSSYSSSASVQSTNLAPIDGGVKNTLQIGDLIPDWRSPNPNTYASR